MQYSTLQPPPRLPTTISKDTTSLFASFSFCINPVECKYHFKHFGQKCTSEVIAAHHTFLERKYKALEIERDNKLHSSFPGHLFQKVVCFVKATIEEVLQNKKHSDQRRLDNLLLDQMQEKARREIRRVATEVEQQHLSMPTYFFSFYTKIFSL